MNFGTYLKLLRTEKEITLRDLSKKSQTDVAYLSRIERGIVSPPQKEDILQRIASALDVSETENQKLLDLANSDNGDYPNDIKNNLKELTAIPILLRTINNKKLSDEQIKELARKVNEEY